MATKRAAKRSAKKYCKIIKFTTSKVVPGIVPKTWFLVVTGTKPCVNMDVSLSPRRYVKKPAYWGIEVIGCLPGGICLTMTAPYSAHLDLKGVIGTKGIEVIGANKKKKHKVP